MAFGNSFVAIAVVARRFKDGSIYLGSLISLRCEQPGDWLWRKMKSSRKLRVFDSPSNFPTENPVVSADFLLTSPSMSTYQMPLSLPVRRKFTMAAAARKGNNVSRDKDRKFRDAAVFPHWRQYKPVACGTIGIRRKR